LLSSRDACLHKRPFPITLQLLRCFCNCILALPTKRSAVLL
jgi:hypothetical protein